jgi:P-type Ca2+ transporter type 2C
MSERFCSDFLVEIGGQVLIVFIGGAAFQVTRIGGREWGISLALGVVSIPLGVLIRLLPTAPFEHFFSKVGLMPNAEIIPLRRTDEWNPAIDRVRDNLSTFANLRGGRVRGSSFVIKNRKAKLREQNLAPLCVSLCAFFCVMKFLIVTFQLVFDGHGPFSCRFFCWSWMGTED